MARGSRGNWLAQIVTIENNGFSACQRGEPRSANPYQSGYNGGGSLQRQRRQAWYRGWDLAKRKE